MFSPTGYIACFRELTNGEIQQAAAQKLFIPKHPAYPVIMGDPALVDRALQPCIISADGKVVPVARVAGLLGVFPATEQA